MNPPSSPAQSARNLAGALALGLVLVIAGMKLFTGHVWEDFFITYRHSENVVSGHGLVYQPGERVHGFTSPLNVVLPAVFHAAQPEGDYTMPLWGFVLLALAALAAGVAAHLTVLRTSAESGHAAESLCFVLLLALQIKLTAFSFNGQEAGFWAGFLLLAFSAINRGVATHWLSAGLACGGLMWTRPDSPVHIFWLGVAALLFPDAPRLAILRGLLRGAAVCAVVYLPWFAWAWWYYGTPVPHTIIAKMGSYNQALHFGGWMQQWPAAISGAFKPIYAEAGGWPGWLHGIALATGVVCAVAWVWPKTDAVLRRASLVFCGSAGYLALVGADGFMFPWYFVPCGVMGAVVVARLIARLPADALKLVAVLPIVAALGYGTVNSLAQLRVHQQLIEEQTRRQVGLWLRSHMAANETVFLEPIGYIGYYSGQRILDWPGLVTPAVVRARKENGNDAWRTIAQLKPNWLVFRPGDAGRFTKDAAVAGDYAAVAEIDTLPKVARYATLPGYGFLSSDARFIIYRRQPAAK